MLSDWPRLWAAEWTMTSAVMTEWLDAALPHHHHHHHHHDDEGEGGWCDWVVRQSSASEVGRRRCCPAADTFPWTRRTCWRRSLPCTCQSCQQHAHNTPTCCRFTRLYLLTEGSARSPSRITSAGSVQAGRRPSCHRTKLSKHLKNSKN